MQLEVSAEVADALRKLDDAIRGASCAPRKWAPLVTKREGRHSIEACIIVEGHRPATFRVGEGQLQEAAWSALGCELDAHGCFRGARVSPFGPPTCGR
jgi:hypothetical protein